MILTYNNNLNIRTSVKFDIKIFIAVLILTYLLAYKLTDYVANFNTVQNISKIEIIFLSIFFIFLFIPMCHINQDKISVKENRTLAKWKPLVTNKGQINYNFGKDYNNWFNDRFNLRQFLLDSHIKLLMNVTNKLPKGRIDKDGFVYGDYELSTSPLKKINDADYNALIKFDKYCKDHNIEFYVLLVPIKKYIYPPTENMLYKDEYAVNIDKKVKELNQKYDMHIVNPIENLKAGTKDTYTYFKTDPHWTFDGAYIGYKELMKEINKKHNDIYVLQEKDFNFYYSPLVNSNFGDVFGYGYYSVHLNLPEKYIQKIHKENYRYFSHKNANALEIKKKQIPLHLNKKYYFPDGADYRVIVFGASMTENLDEFMPYTFKNLFHLRINNVKNVPASEEYKVMKHYEKEMMSYKPDIIVLCIGYIELYKLHDFFKK